MELFQCPGLGDMQIVGGQDLAPDAALAQINKVLQNGLQTVFGNEGRTQFEGAAVLQVFSQPVSILVLQPFETNSGSAPPAVAAAAITGSIAAGAAGSADAAARGRC